MLDGVYQSAIAFFMVYLIFSPANFATGDGLDIADLKRMGVFVATIAVFSANLYVLFNTFRWDWIMLLVVIISTLMVWFWTGIYTSFTASAQFYKGGAEVYGSLVFWAVLLCAVIISLLPRFTVKVVQKLYFPLDVDIIREQVRQGKFDYLKDTTAFIPPPPEKVASQAGSESPKFSKPTTTLAQDDDRRPIYPPSVAPTATTHNPRSQNGSNSTDYTFRRSLEGGRNTFDGTPAPAHRMSVDRPRPSYDRARMSMSQDRVRPSFEASNDFTSAALLTRMESSHSRNSYGAQPGQTNNVAMSRLRNVFRRPTVTREEAPDFNDSNRPPLPKSPPRSPPQ
jgi:phospholipid-translocating ATPase